MGVFPYSPSPPSLGLSPLALFLPLCLLVPRLYPTSLMLAKWATLRPLCSFGAHIGWGLCCAFLLGRQIETGFATCKP